MQYFFRQMKVSVQLQAPVALSTERVPIPNKLEGSLELRAGLGTLERRKNSYAAGNRTKIPWSFSSCHYICCTVIYFLNLI